jgi:hypothetical protein
MYSTYKISFIDLEQSNFKGILLKKNYFSNNHKY